MAAVVECDLVWERCVKVGYPETVDQELRKFVTFARKLAGSFFVAGFGEEFGVKNFEHRPTRTRGDNDHLSIFEPVENRYGHLTSLRPVPGIERGLTTAGQFFGIVDRVSKLFQDFNHADP